MNEPRQCSQCGKPLPNDTYGSRCEDCWAEAAKECVSKPPGSSHIARLGNRRVGQHQTDAS